VSSSSAAVAARGRKNRGGRDREAGLSGRRRENLREGECQEGMESRSGRKQTVGTTDFQREKPSEPRAEESLLATVETAGKDRTRERVTDLWEEKTLKAESSRALLGRNKPDRQ
jgi:hypothetical protein